MITTQTVPLNALYEQDETAWLEAMADLVNQKRVAEMDFPHLSEYLADMAKRDRREVFSRLVVLMTHLLKWDRQPDRRTGSWRGTIRAQRRELRLLLESGTLRNHAEAVLDQTYAESRLQAADETELAAESFPAERPWGLDDLLADDDA